MGKYLPTLDDVLPAGRSCTNWGETIAVLRTQSHGRVDRELARLTYEAECGDEVRLSDLRPAWVRVEPNAPDYAEEPGEPCWMLCKQSDPGASPVWVIDL